MRHSLAALILLIAACTPPRTDAPPAPQDKVATVGAAAAAAAQPANTNAAILTASPIDAVWHFGISSSDGYTIASLGYRGRPNEPIPGVFFDIICTDGDKSVDISLDLDHDVPDRWDTTIRFITATQTVDIPARSYITRSISAELDGADPRLDALRDPQKVFAIEAEGQTRVVVWDQAINRVLNACSV